MKTIIATLLFTLLISGCDYWEPDFYCNGDLIDEVGSTEAYIVNGDVPQETLSTVVLFNRDIGNYNCSGVAFKPQIVLTAAHCVGTTNIAVSRNLNAPLITVDDIYVHREYKDYPDFDIAVLHLAEPIEGPFPAGIYDLAAGGYTPDFRYYCKGLVAEGFGTTLGTNPPGLYSLPYEIGDGDGIHRLIGAPKKNDAGVCYGDSGSPVYAFMDSGHPWIQEDVYLVAAITIGTYDGNGCTGRSLHSNLDVYKKWIYESIYCLNGGEDREWDFWILSGDGYKGSTCEELRKPLNELGGQQ